MHPHTALPTHPSLCPCPGHHRRFSQPMSPLCVQAPSPRAAASFFRDPTPSSGPFLAGEIHGGWCLWCFASTGDKHSKTHALHCPALDLRVLVATAASSCSEKKAVQHQGWEHPQQIAPSHPGSLGREMGTSGVAPFRHCSHLWGAALQPSNSHQALCHPPSPHATSGTAGVSSSITLSTASFEELLVGNQKEASKKP